MQLTGKTWYEQCPISLIDHAAMGIYELVNLSFGDGKISPLELLELPNVWFEYLRTVRNAEHKFEEETKNNGKV